MADTQCDFAAAQSLWAEAVTVARAANDRVSTTRVATASRVAASWRRDGGGRVGYRGLKIAG
jgi:hypothetical protein